MPDVASPPLTPVVCCPSCRATAARQVSRVSVPIGLLRCDACGLIRATATYATGFLDTDYYGTKAEAADHDAAFMRERKRLQLALYDRLCGGRLRAPPENGRALDVGCGIGALLDVLDEYGWATEGIERAPAAASVAQRRHHVHDVDVEDDAIDLGRRYDLVTATHFIEHLRDTIAGLRFMSRHLVPDGRLVIEVPNWNDWARSLWGLHYRPLALGDHIAFFDRTTLRDTLERAGFVVDVIWAKPQGASTVLPSVLTAVDLVRRIRFATRRRPPAPGVASETRAPRSARGLRTTLLRSLDRLDPLCDRMTHDHATWGANLVAIARVSHASNQSDDLHHNEG